MKKKIVLFIFPILTFVLTTAIIAITVAWYMGTPWNFSESNVTVSTATNGGGSVNATLEAISDNYDLNNDGSYKTADTGLVAGYSGQTGREAIDGYQDRPYIIFYRVTLEASSPEELASYDYSYISKCLVTWPDDDTKETEDYTDATVEGSAMLKEFTTIFLKKASGDKKGYVFTPVNVLTPDETLSGVDNPNQVVFYLGIQFYNQASSVNSDGSFYFSNTKYMGSHFFLEIEFFSSAENPYFYVTKSQNSSNNYLTSREDLEPYKLSETTLNAFEIAGGSNNDNIKRVFHAQHLYFEKGERVSVYNIYTGMIYNLGTTVNGVTYGFANQDYMFYQDPDNIDFGYYIYLSGYYEVRFWICENTYKAFFVAEQKLEDGSYVTFDDFDGDYENFDNSVTFDNVRYYIKGGWCEWGNNLWKDLEYNYDTIDTQLTKTTLKEDIAVNEDDSIYYGLSQVKLISSTREGEYSETKHTYAATIISNDIFELLGFSSQEQYWKDFSINKVNGSNFLLTAGKYRVTLTFTRAAVGEIWDKGTFSFEKITEDYDPINNPDGLTEAEKLYLSEAVEQTWYLRGSFDPDWGCLPEYKFTKDTEIIDGITHDYYYLNHIALTAKVDANGNQVGTQFKVSNQGWSPSFNQITCEYTEEGLEAFSLVDDGFGGGNIICQISGYYDLKFSFKNRLDDDGNVIGVYGQIEATYTGAYGDVTSTTNYRLEGYSTDGVVNTPVISGKSYAFQETNTVGKLELLNVYIEQNWYIRLMNTDDSNVDITVTSMTDNGLLLSDYFDSGQLLGLYWSKCTKSGYYNLFFDETTQTLTAEYISAFGISGYYVVGSMNDWDFDTAAAGNYVFNRYLKTNMYVYEGPISNGWDPANCWGFKLASQSWNPQWSHINNFYDGNTVDKDSYLNDKINIVAAPGQTLQAPTDVDWINDGNVYLTDIGGTKLGIEGIYYVTIILVEDTENSENSTVTMIIWGTTDDSIPSA